MIKKKIILFTLIMLTITGFLSAQNKELKQYDNLYGIGEYDYNSEVDFLNGLYSNGLYKLLKDIKFIGRDFNELKPYIKKMDDDTLEGTCIRDSILCYIGYENNDKLIQLLKKSRKNESVQYLLKIRKNIENYINTPFNFSTTPNRYKTPLGVNLMLPNTEWQINGQGDDFITIIAGDDNYTGSVHIRTFKIQGSVEDFIQNNFFSNYTPSIIIRYPKNGQITKKDMIELDSVMPRLVKKNYSNKTLPNDKRKKFNSVYESINCSPQKYDFQVYVSRTRFYIEGNNCTMINIYSYISGKHALADKKRLIKKYGQILDSVYFE